MAVINFARREIEAKIVFYGPALSGKTTNVKMAHASVPVNQRGQLSTLATEDERTLYFDYAPITLGKIANFDAHFKLFSVPGQAYYSETRKAVLQGADGVVFVADSAPDRAKANIESLIDLERNLKALGHKLSQFPLVLQLNKRDVPGARTVEDLARDLNWFGAPIVEASALTGEGVSATLQAISRATADRIREGLAGKESPIAVEAVERSERKSDAEVIVDQLAAIRGVRPGEEAKAKEDLARGKLRPDDVDSFLFHNVVREGIGADLLIEDDEDTDSVTGGTLARFPDLRLGLLPPALSGWRVKEVRSAQVTAEGGVRLEVVIRERQGRRRALCVVLLEARVEPEPVARGEATMIRPLSANNPLVNEASFSGVPPAPPPPQWKGATPNLAPSAPVAAPASSPHAAIPGPVPPRSPVPTPVSAPHTVIPGPVPPPILSSPSTAPVTLAMGSTNTTPSGPASVRNVSAPPNPVAPQKTTSRAQIAGLMMALVIAGLLIGLGLMLLFG